MAVSDDAPPALHPPLDVRATREASGTARVLVIDDEELLLSVMGRILHDYDVETTTDALHAIALIEGGPAFDVILVDVTMPVMSGLAFFQALRAAHPALAGRVIFMSGGVFEADVEACLEAMPNVRIAKPFRGMALRQAVRETLDRAAAPAHPIER